MGVHVIQSCAAEGRQYSTRTETHHTSLIHLGNAGACLSSRLFLFRGPMREMRAHTTFTLCISDDVVIFW